MKTYLKILSLVVAGSLSLGLPSIRANLEVSAGVQINATADFDSPLAYEGAWVDIHSYGRCWHPAHVGADWRPYCNGEWVWTDCGWYWQSDEPWAWACYHYGSWTFDTTYGWVWLPGIEWAPAWVTWRTGGGFVGWAPCGPRGVVVAPEFFAFVDIGHFHDRIRPESVRFRDQAIIRQTTQIAEVRRETRNIDGRARPVVVNEGPGVEPIQKATGHEIKAVPVRDVTSRTQFPSTMERRTANPAGGERAVPPLDEKSLQKNETAPTRGVNPVPPNDQIPRKEEIAPRQHGVTSTPAPNEQAPRKQGVAPPARNVAPAPPANERIPRKEEAIPPARSVTQAPPATERAPRKEEVTPAPARPPTTVEPRREAPAEHPHPAEQPKGEGKHEKEP